GTRESSKEQLPSSSLTAQISGGSDEESQEESAAMPSCQDEISELNQCKTNLESSKKNLEEATKTIENQEPLLRSLGTKDEMIKRLQNQITLMDEERAFQQKNLKELTKVDEGIRLQAANSLKQMRELMSENNRLRDTISTLESLKSEN